MNIFHSVAELAGNTPLLELCRYEHKHGLNARILAKLECCNVAGSAKDRVAKHMIERAEAEGKLVPGSVIIEPTSGNTGIGLAAMAKVHGYRVILTMPESMSVERRSLLRAYGAALEALAGCVRNYRGYQKRVTKTEFVPAFEEYEAGCSATVLQLDAGVSGLSDAERAEKLTAAAERLIDELEQPLEVFDEKLFHEIVTDICINHHDEMTVTLLGGLRFTEQI